MDSETLETSPLTATHGEVVKSGIIQMAEVESSSSSTPTAECSENKIIWQINASEEEVLSRKWKKPSETMTVVQHFLDQGMTPKQVLSHLLPQYSIPVSMTDEFAIQVLLELFSEKRTREKLPQYNTFDHAVELFRKSERILVLTGAGVSVSCGIPDFRSKNGIYARLHKDFPELPDPTAMFDIDFFKSNPAPFYNFAKEIFPGQFKPSISHMFIKFLEEEGKLLRNYTQNIDTLEKIAGIERVLECHGSFARSTCLNCKTEIDSAEIKDDVFAQRVAYCKQCKTGVLKPNIVFFGEDLGEQFHHQMGEDHDQVDLLVVVGSSLKVQPVALIPFNIDPSVPQILINREQLSQYQADIKLLGNCDEIILALCMAIGGRMREKMIKELKNRPKQFPHWQSGDGEGESLQNGEVTSETPVPMPSSQSCSGVPKVICISEFRRMVDEPPAKRKCGGTEDNENTNNAQVGGEEDAEEAMWESNYVRVEDALQQNSLLFVPPNLNVFKGAELYYERDAGTFSRQPGPAVSRACGDDEDDDDLLDDEEDDDSRRCSTSSDGNGSSSDEAHSLPANLKFHDTAEDSSEELTVPPLQRPESCPMPFLTVEEVEEALAEQRDIRTLLEQEEANSGGVKDTAVETPETLERMESVPV